MKKTSIRKLITAACFIMGSVHLSAEEIVTTKKDEPDGFYGLKIGGILSPSYNQRMRDGGSGLTNAYPNEEPGFSTPWTLLTINKEFKETGVSLELWGELLRSAQVSADTRMDGGVKSNPYILGIRRALIRKTWETGLGEYSLTFGMQELPHTYTQWKNYWRWRYVDKGPLESLGFAPAPADIGLGGTGKWDNNISAQVILSNGEGYRQTQNTDSTGFDLSSRLSYEPKIGDENRIGLHFFYRSANLTGASSADCKEGTACLASDNNPSTSLRKDVRSLESDSYAVEANFDRKKILNFGLGYVFRKQKGGEVRDVSKPFGAVTPGLDSTGTAAYAWLSLGWGDFRIVGRLEGGSGRDGVLAANRTQINQVMPGSPESDYWNIQTNTVGPLVNSSGYSVHSSFRRGSVFAEWNITDSLRVSIGYTESRNRDKDGDREQSYVDGSGNERTKAEYLQQFQGGANNGIVSYGRLTKELTLWTTIEF